MTSSPVNQSHLFSVFKRYAFATIQEHYKCRNQVQRKGAKKSFYALISKGKFLDVFMIPFASFIVKRPYTPALQGNHNSSGIEALLFVSNSRTSVQNNKMKLILIIAAFGALVYSFPMDVASRRRTRSFHSSFNSESRCGERAGKMLKIVGGKVTMVESHPWIASIFWRGRFMERAFKCGGSLIAPCWVVTAAHCFPNGAQTKLHSLTVFLGKNAINATDFTREQKFRVEELIIHHGFDNREGNYNNDIALLKIIGNYGGCAEESASVRPVCLPPPNQMLPAGFSCEIAGYGKEREGSWQNSQYLKEARVNLLSQDICTSRNYYGKMVTNNMFCAGSPDWKIDSCKADSGGPLVCEVDHRLFLFGIISWGEGCSQEFRPGVYTRITKYNHWIGKKTGLASIAAGSMYPQK